MHSNVGKEDIWRGLVNEILSCKRCPLHKYRKKAVPGEGSLDSKIVFIGEAPGQKEDEEGRPFVGSAGKLLTELLESIGMRRGEVFITNVVKCRPPNNREPYDDEVEACKPYTTAILTLIKPKVIVTLGNYAGKFVFELGNMRWYGVSKARGKVYRVKVVDLGEVMVIPTYHPAAALYNPNVRGVLEHDFNLIRDSYSKALAKSGDRGSGMTLLNFMNVGEMNEH